MVVNENFIGLLSISIHSQVGSLGDRRLLVRTCEGLQLPVRTLEGLRPVDIPLPLALPELDIPCVKTPSLSRASRSIKSRPAPE